MKDKKTANEQNKLPPQSASSEENDLSEMKSRFLSIASHEFRTPLAGILSSLNLMNRYLDVNEAEQIDPRQKEKIKKHIDKISESVKNLTAILNKFLALGNIEKGEIPINYSSFDMQELIQTQKALFEEISKPGQSINYTYKGKQRRVYLDLYLLKNILNNLLANAINFSPEKAEIQIESEITSNEICIKISDHGIGIPAAEQKNIFRRFYRASNALAFQEGTGLGLNIVKKYVELMQGSITFTSIENQGTTFFITFVNKANTSDEKNIGD